MPHKRIAQYMLEEKNIFQIHTDLQILSDYYYERVYHVGWRSGFQVGQMDGQDHRCDPAAGLCPECEANAETKGGGG